MKKIVVTITGVILAALLIVGAVNLRPVFAQTPAQSSTTAALRTLHVTGSGVAVVQPDTAVVIIGVRTEAVEASAALDQNSQRMTALIAALRQAGVAEENIQTTNIDLSPRYADQTSANGQPQITGYIATNTVQVRIMGVEKVGSILDAAVKEGGNLIQGIFFEVSDPGAAQEQARAAAYDDAVRKAESLASISGVQLGQIVTISEVSASQPLPAASVRAEAVALAVPVQAGTQNIQVDLEVTWEITGGQALVPRTGRTATLTRTPTATLAVPRTPTTAATLAATATVAATATDEPTSAVPTVGVTPLATETAQPTEPPFTATPTP